LFILYSSGINRTAYNLPDLKRTCSNFVTIQEDNSDFNGDSLSVIFQTNRNMQNIGFFMVVTCVSPDFYNLNGCTPAQTPQPQTPAPPGPPGRRKRETEIDKLVRYFATQYAA